MQDFSIHCRGLGMWDLKFAGFSFTVVGTKLRILGVIGVEDQPIRCESFLIIRLCLLDSIVNKALK